MYACINIYVFEGKRMLQRSREKSVTCDCLQYFFFCFFYSSAYLLMLLLFGLRYFECAADFAGNKRKISLRTILKIQLLLLFFFAII